MKDVERYLKLGKDDSDRVSECKSKVGRNEALLIIINTRQIRKCCLLEHTAKDLAFRYQASRCIVRTELRIQRSLFRFEGTGRLKRPHSA